MERRPDAVILNGVRPSPGLWRSSSRTVLVLQRLEPEKDTLTALRAWKASRLVDEGWLMRIVGDGSERAELEAWAKSEGVEGVTFAGWVTRTRDELANAGIFLAPAPAEPFGLAVVEAMAAGVPVAACAAGGHLETVGNLDSPVLFRPRDHVAAASALRLLRDDDSRERQSDAGRNFVRERLTTARHVDELVDAYAGVLTTGHAASEGPQASKA
jgi:glycosyltransferase involved in cell wall biosynthesis